MQSDVNYLFGGTMIKIVEQNPNRLKRSLVFVYISVIVHLYVMLIITLTVDKEFFEKLLNPQLMKKDTVIENIIVNTATQSEEVPTEGKISDKANIGKGKLSETEKYNYFNPELNPKQAKQAIVNPQPQIETGKELMPNDSDFKLKSGNKETIAKQATSISEKSGDYHTSFFDPEKSVDVQMNSEGNISLDTIPTEYAGYFLAMSKKISEQWKEFFPIFQYYQGIIKSGDTVIHFTVDSDGNVVSPKIADSYGYGVIDSACLDAVEYSKNFGELPDGLKEHGEISINFKFIYIAK